jgi:hypothetical protein
MIAICPAGPPKLMNPSFSQNQNASRSVGRTVAEAAPDVWPGSPVAASVEVGCMPE